MGKKKGKGGGFGGLADAFVKGGVATDKEARKSRRERAEEDRGLGRRGVDEREAKRRETDLRRRDTERDRQRALAASMRDGVDASDSPRPHGKEGSGLPRVGEVRSGTVAEVQAGGVSVRFPDGLEGFLPGDGFATGSRVSVRCLGSDDRGRLTLARD